MVRRFGGNPKPPQFWSNQLISGLWVRTVWGGGTHNYLLTVTSILAYFELWAPLGPLVILKGDQRTQEPIIRFVVYGFGGTHNSRAASGSGFFFESKLQGSELDLEAWRSLP